MQKRLSKNVQIVLAILKDELKGDIKSALKKLTSDYIMTWVYKSPKHGTLFPKTKKNIEGELAEAYPIKSRQYDIKNITEGNNVVMVEMIESYPDPKTRKVYRTPLVIVLEMKNGKIRRGRHYCDPKLSYLYLKKSQLKKVFS